MSTPNLTKFFTNFANSKELLDNDGTLLFRQFKAIKCQDGYKFSCQAGIYLASTPKLNLFSETEFLYSHMELSQADTDSFIPYDDGGIYANVPVEMIEDMIVRHGGLLIENNNI